MHKIFEHKGWVGRNRRQNGITAENHLIFKDRAHRVRRMAGRGDKTVAFIKCLSIPDVITYFNFASPLLIRDTFPIKTVRHHANTARTGEPGLHGSILNIRMARYHTIESCMCAYNTLAVRCYLSQISVMVLVPVSDNNPLYITTADACDVKQLYKCFIFSPLACIDQCQRVFVNYMAPSRPQGPVESYETGTPRP